MRNLHQIILQVYGLEAQHLFRDWKRLQLRASDYKNHRIFTLRCLHKELIPVQHQAKVNFKNRKGQENNQKSRERFTSGKSQSHEQYPRQHHQTNRAMQVIVSIYSISTKLRECQGFVDKVGEIRFTKVKQRQINKLNNLLNKKEGNITRSNSSPNLAFQAGRQAGAYLPPGEESNLMAQATQSGRQAGTHLPPRERGSLSQSVTSQSGALLPPRGRKQLSGTGHSVRQAGRCLPFPLGKEAVYLSQLLPSQVLSFPLGKEATQWAQAHSVRQAGRCSPFPWGRRQFISVSYLPVRQAGFPGRHSPSSQGRKQFSSITGRQSGFPGLPSRQAGNFSFSQGRRQSSSFPNISGRCSSFPCQGKFFPRRHQSPCKSSRQSSYQVRQEKPQVLSQAKGPSRLPRGTALPPRQTVLVPRMAISHLTP